MDKGREDCKVTVVSFWKLL